MHGNCRHSCKGPCRQEEAVEAAVGEGAVEQAGPAGAEDKDSVTVHGAELVQTGAHREGVSGNMHDRRRVGFLCKAPRAGASCCG